MLALKYPKRSCPRAINIDSIASSISGVYCLGPTKIRFKLPQDSPCGTFTLLNINAPAHQAIPVLIPSVSISTKATAGAKTTSRTSRMVFPKDSKAAAILPRPINRSGVNILKRRLVDERAEGISFRYNKKRKSQ